ncbi:hypothetical protein D3C75_1032850 [compost metagenome]
MNKSKIIYLSIFIAVALIFSYKFLSSSTTTIISTTLVDFDSNNITILDSNGKHLKIDINNKIDTENFRKNSLYTVVYKYNAIQKPRLIEINIVD